MADRRFKGRKFTQDGAAYVAIEKSDSTKLTIDDEGIPVSVDEFPGERIYTRTLFQGTNVNPGTAAASYSVSLADVDMETVTIVTVVGTGGQLTVKAQVSFDGSSNKAPKTPVTLFSDASAGASPYIKGLKSILTDGTNPIWGPFMTGDIDVAATAATIDIYMMAQGK